MVYVNQLQSLMDYGVEENKAFLGSLYSSGELVDASREFDFLDCSVSFRRQDDEGMTLDRFLGLIDDKTLISFQLASPKPFDIRYGARLRDGEITRFLFIDCPYTDDNFDVVSRLYEESFGRKLEEEPVLEGLREIYEERVKLGY